MKPLDAALSSPQRDEMARDTLDELRKKYHGKLESKDLAAEVWALRQENQSLKIHVGELCVLKEQDKIHIERLTGMIDKIKEISLDQVTLMGQVDVALTAAREISLDRFLNPEFKKILQNQSRRSGGGRETRHEKNQLLHEDLDSIVTRRSKETKVRTLVNLITIITNLSPA